MAAYLHLRRGRRGVLAVALVLAFLSAGCGGGSGGKSGQDDVAQGRELFQLGPKGSQLSCSFCHTLKAAQAVGPFGPSLDQEGQEYHRLKWTDSKIRSWVLGWMKKGNCIDPHDPSRCMPPGLVDDGNADAIAAFVTACAGKPATGTCKAEHAVLQGNAETGRRFFATLGCVSCHWTAGPPNLGPSFNGLAGSKVELASGKTVTADDDYLLTSILAPDQDTVKGYPHGLMSSRVPPGQISVAQAKAIIAYIKTLK
jgi:mono/diheme cytochrome c family protein